MDDGRWTMDDEQVSSIVEGIKTPRLCVLGVLVVKLSAYFGGVY
jgi:hypothetical protein